MSPDFVKVGIGIFLINNGKILLSVRKTSHGKGEYALPGGHLEPNESFEECVRRELAEEAGNDIKLKSIKFLCVTNLQKYTPKHYVDIGMLAEYKSGKPKMMEPQKKSDWKWYDLDNLPNPLFGCTENYVKAFSTGQAYFSN